jgi:chorismate-pyruvate lyase
VSDDAGIPSNNLYLGCVARLTGLFYPDVAELGTFEPIEDSDLSDDGRTLLAHNNHMTVTLEAFHNSLVDVHVLTKWEDDASYAREILLSRQSDGAVVLYGIMRIWTSDLPRAVQEEIHGAAIPLGRILIRHNLLRDVQLTRLWRVVAGERLEKFLGIRRGRAVPGRSAEILVADRPTVQLLEVVNVET